MLHKLEATGAVPHTNLRMQASSNASPLRARRAAGLSPAVEEGVRSWVEADPVAVASPDGAGPSGCESRRRSSATTSSVVVTEASRLPAFEPCMATFGACDDS
jgi:hypothetical protein